MPGWVRMFNIGHTSTWYNHEIIFNPSHTARLFLYHLSITLGFLMFSRGIEASGMKSLNFFQITKICSKLILYKPSTINFPRVNQTAVILKLFNICPYYKTCSKSTAKILDEVECAQVTIKN